MHLPNAGPLVSLGPEMMSQIEFDADIKNDDNRQGSKYKRYGSDNRPVLLDRVLDLGDVPFLPPSLLGHESAIGCQT